MRQEINRSEFQLIGVLERQQRIGGGGLELVQS